MFRHLFPLAVSALLLGVSSPMVHARPELHFLKNGLPVITDHRPGNPVVMVRLGVRAGSSRDNSAGAGLAHFSEHLLATYVEFAKKNGMFANAMTGNDVVSYFLRGPSRRFAEIMDVFGESVTKREFSDTLFENERRAVVEETKMRAGNPDIVMYETMAREAYLEHPYGYPTAGEPSLTPFVTKEQVSEYIKHAFVTPNMVLVVVGGVSPKDVLESAEKNLGSIAMGPYAPVVLPQENPRNFAHRVELTHDREDARIQIAFSGMRYGHPDMGSLDMLGTILTSLPDSPLRKQLTESGLATEAYCYNNTPMGPGLFICGASTSAENLPLVERIILDILHTAKTSGVSEDDLDAAKKLLELEEEQGVRSVGGMAGKLADFWFFNRSVAGFPDRMKTFYGNVNVESIRDAASRYLRKERSTTVTIAPKQEVSPVRVEEQEMRQVITRMVLPDNTVMLHVPAVEYSTGVMSATFPVSTSDPTLRSAFDLLPKVLENEYSRTIASIEYKDLKNSGIKFSFFMGYDQFSVHVSDIPKSKEARVVELLFNLIRPEKPDAEVISSAKQSYALEEKEAAEDAWEKAKRAIREEFFTSGHRYGLKPDLEEIEQVNQNALEEALRIISDTAPTVAVGGGIDLEEVKSSWPSNLKSVARGSENEEEPLFASGGSDHRITANAKTTQIVYALRIPGVHGKTQSVAAAAMAIAVNELNDRIEKETRDKSGLSYSQGVVFSKFRYATYLALYVETSDSSRVPEVLQLMRTLVQDMANTKISAEKFAELQERRVTSFEMGDESLDSRMGRALSAESLYQTERDYVQIFSEANGQANSELITSILSDALARNLTVSVVVSGTEK